MADSKYVTLVSKEGFEFVALREATLVSPTMKGMLRGNFSEAQTGRCTFPEVRYAVHLLFSPSAHHPISSSPSSSFLAMMIHAVP